MRAGRIVVIVSGCILGILGLGLLIAGIAGTVAYGVARDDDGYFRTDEIHLSTPTSAITSASLDLGSAPGDAEWITARGDFATVILDLQPVGSGQELFAGIGPTDEVTRYLASVPHDSVSDYDDSSSTVTYERQAGSATPAPPADQTFWVAEVATAQPGTLTWDVKGGDWTVVVMNADGSSGVDANARVGIKIDWLLPVAIVLIVLGAVVLVGGTLLGVFVGRTRRQQPLPAPAIGSTLPPPTGPDSPSTNPAPQEPQDPQHPDGRHA
ncbi:MAG: hypothetical protein ABW328_03645 [Ilumatobacteraceae bacterium]